MDQDKLPIFPYVSFREWHDPRSGLMFEAFGPMYSTGYQSTQNRPAILVETHMLKPYKVRVDATLAVLHHTAEILARDRENILRLNKEADVFTASKAFREKEIPLAFKESNENETVEFKGFDYTNEKSDLTNGIWIKYDNTKPMVFKLPFYNTLMTISSVLLPEAYIIPSEWSEVIKKLDFHGIKYKKLKNEKRIKVKTIKFEKPRWSARPIEGHFTIENVEMHKMTEEHLFPAGSALVRTNQRTARLIAHLLEPGSHDSLLRWGFFNAIFEQKEYGEPYALEGLAREMLAKEPALKTEFEGKKLNDKGFAQSPSTQLNWFYLRSPYGDSRLNLYPVGRIEEEAVVKELLKYCH